MVQAALFVFARVFYSADCVSHTTPCLPHAAPHVSQTTPCVPQGSHLDQPQCITPVVTHPRPWGAPPLSYLRLVSHLCLPCSSPRPSGYSRLRPELSGNLVTRGLIGGSQITGRSCRSGVSGVGGVVGVGGVGGEVK